MRKLYITFIVIFLGLASKAQVKGAVIDSAAKKPIDKAVIGLVVKSNLTDTIYTFTDEKGQFRFETVPASSFSIVIRNMGYRPVAKFVPVNKMEKSIDVGTVILVDQAKTLGEVVVEVAAITVKEDTIEYNASSFKVKEGAVVEDLLKKLPGVQVDKDGNVTAQGKSVSRIKVNGKDFFGGDVKTATKELPANIVDKIQVIDDYGDQATVSGIKDGDPDKIINIQIKKDKNKGFFGRATAGYGTQDRYQASFNGNFFNNNRQISVLGNSNNTNTSLFNFGGGGNRGATSMMRTGMSAMSDMGGMGGMNNMMQSGNGAAFSGGNNSGISTTHSVGFNYRDQWSKRISVYGSYSYNYKNTSQEQNSYESNSATGYNINQDQNSLTKGNSHRFTFNFEYQVDSFNYLKISPSINYSGSDANSNTNFDYAQTDGTKTQEGSNKNLNGSKAPNLAATILYNHKFRKRGRNFSSSVTLGTSDNNSEQDITNLNYQYIPLGTRNSFQFIDQQNDNYSYGVRFTYSEPINKYRSLDLSYSRNLNHARNDRKTFNVDSATKAKTLNSTLSDDYENDYYYNRIGVSIRTTKKKYNYTLGISVQPVDLKGNSITKDSSYTPIKRVNVFPIARLVYNFNRTKALNVSYNGNATQPTFTQLQPVPNFDNPQSVTTGNPDLKPSINHNINLSYNNFNFISGKVMFTNLTFSTIRNQIVNKTAKRNDRSGSTISIPENVNGYYNVLGLYTFSKPYKNRKYVLTLNGSVNYNHNISLTDSALLIGNTVVQDLDLNKVNGNNWIVSQGFTFEYNFKEILELGTGVSYSLNNNKYSSTDSKALTNFQNTSSNAWTFSNNINLNITKTLVLKYDFDYTINTGLASSVSQNLAIMNASLEKQLFKKKNGILKLAAYDLFNQNTNINRSVKGTSIIDTRTNRLTRYFMVTFTYRLQKFAGQTIQGQGTDLRRMGPPNIKF